MKIKGIIILGVILAVGLGLAAVPVGTAGIYAPTNFYEIRVQGEDRRKPQYVSVNNRRLDLALLHPRVGFDDRDTPKANRWLILGTKIKSSIGRYYLAYDPSGKDDRIFLSAEAGPGTDWQFDKRDKEDRDLFLATAQAASGKVKGWYLGAEEEEKARGAIDEPETTYRLVLRKDRTKAAVHIFRLYAYRSTAR